MQEQVQQSFEIMLHNWNQMQKSDMENAEEDANRFQASFYQFIDQVRAWFEQLDPKPLQFEEAVRLPLVASILDDLPGPLLINFETELELIVQGEVRDPDDFFD